MLPDSGILLLGFDIVDWLFGIGASLVPLVMAYRVGRLRERNAEKQIQLTDYEKRVREQETRIAATDRDIDRRTADLDTIDRRLVDFEQRRINLENEIDDAKREQSKAGVRMNQAGIRLAETEAELLAVKEEREDAADMLRRTKESRRIGRGDLKKILKQGS